MKYFFTLFFFSCTTLCLSQEYNFSSTLEKDFFEHYITDTLNVDFFEGLHVIDSTITKTNLEKHQNSTDQFIATLPGREIKEKKEIKRIKVIYDKIHKKFFNQYVIDAYFPEIFTTGSYNCVSATALYAYIFDKLKIPYVVKESPAHVYMIAYPESYNIYLETTVPGVLAFKEFERSQIKETVNTLVESKLISQDSLNIKGYDKLFYEYFYNNESLKTKSLIGIQYYNKAILQSNKEQFDSAEEMLRKSKVFYNSEMLRHFYKNIQLQKLSNLDYTSKDVIKEFVNSINQLQRDEDYKISSFKSTVYNYLIEDSVEETSILSSLEIFKTITDSIARNEALELTYLYLIDENTSRNKTKKSLQYLTKLDSINPKHKDINKYLGYNIARTFAYLPMTKKSLDSINYYINRYPELEKDNRIVSLKFNFLLYNTYNDFKAKKVNPAEENMKILEKYYAENKEHILIPAEQVAELYRAAGSYYYGRKKYGNAINYYQKGLIHSPENSQLKKLLKWAKEDN